MIDKQQIDNFLGLAEFGSSKFDRTPDFAKTSALAAAGMILENILETGVFDVGMLERAKVICMELADS